MSEPSRTPHLPTSVFVRRALIVGAVGVAGALAVLYTRLLANTMLVVFAGLLLAVFLNGLGGLLRRRLPLSRRAAFAASVVALLLLVLVAGWWIGPRAVEQMSGLPQRLQEVLDDARGTLEGLGVAAPLLEQPGAQLRDGASMLAGGVMGAFGSVIGTMANMVLIAVIGLFVAWNPGAYTGPLLLLLPDGGPRSRGREVLSSVVEALESWLAGRFASMAVVTGLTVGGLLVAGVPLALGLGVIAGVLSFVPFLGPLAAAVPAVLVGLSVGPTTALVVAAIYGGVQSVESYLLTPVIQHRVVSLPPALIVTVQAVMGLLFGIVGILVATPVALVAVVLVQTLYLQDRLHEDVEPAGSDEE